MPRWLERSESQRLEALASFTRHIAVEQTTRCTGGYDSEAFFGISQDERAEFSEIRIVVDVESDAAPEQLSRWTSEVEKRCPVIDNLVYTTRVTIHQHLR